MLPEAVADLARSGISQAQAEAAGMYTETSADAAFEDAHPLPALVIPYFTVNGDPVTYTRDGEAFAFGRVRYLKPPPIPYGKKKAPRYGQPAGSGTWAYFPQGTPIDWPSVKDDPATPLIITEGEKKALAACLAEIPTIGLGGVSNFMRDGRLLDELDAFAWRGRTVVICFDSDAADNPQIQAAEGRLATELSMRRGALVHLARLPGGGQKVGLDDFLVAHGREKTLDVLEAAKQMRRIDAAVLSLNESVAWVEEDGALYDLKTAQWLRKENFVNGSQYSSLKMLVPTAKGDGVKEISVAAEWLKHPHAQRFTRAIFRPEAPRVIVDAGSPMLNLWTGWDAEPGDVAPFMELSEFLFRDLPEQWQDLPLRLMAYKAQNPEHKVPLALVLIGSQGSGKSMWAQIVREAFAPYGVEVPSAALLSQFNGWLERALVAVINEAEATHVTKGTHVLKSLISEKRVMLNEKFRPARQIDNFASFILTSNEHKVGAYSDDDRRMFVVETPEKREYEFYARVSAWLRAGGARHLMHWFLTVDLEGWKPPAQAPLTSAKYMSYIESLTPAQRLAEDCKTATENTVKLWIDSALAWATVAELDANTAKVAREIIESLSAIQIRPWYTPAELAMMFPHLSHQMQGRAASATPGEISRQLRDAGIRPLMPVDDPRGFLWQGRHQQFLVISDRETWRRPLPQSEFDRLMATWPRYFEIDGAKKSSKLSKTKETKK